MAAIETVLGFCWEFSRAVGADERESGPALQAKLRRRWIFVLAATTWHLRRLDVYQYRPFTGRTALLHPLRTFALLFIFRPRFLLQPPPRAVPDNKLALAKRSDESIEAVAHHRRPNRHFALLDGCFNQPGRLIFGCGRCATRRSPSVLGGLITCALASRSRRAV